MLHVEGTSPVACAFTKCRSALAGSKGRGQFYDCLTASCRAFAVLGGTFNVQCYSIR